MSTKLQQLQKQKQLQNPDNIQAVVSALVETITLQKLKEMEGDIQKEARDIMLEIVREDGATKLKGDRGSDGVDGKDGIDGKDGTDGRDGKDGIDGRNGKDGIDGKDGENGVNGKDGSPDTPDQVVDKANIAKKKIAMSVIEGLTDEFATLRQSIRTIRTEKGGGSQGGGGMGNVQHESHAVSSATTNITTAHKIAGSGFAIMGAYYQGQLIARGTHYVVGVDHKTLTLTFTPEDATIIDIIYIRA
jgi:hypothetical protein